MPSCPHVLRSTDPNFLLDIHVCLQSIDLRSTAPQLHSSTHSRVHGSMDPQLLRFTGSQVHRSTGPNFLLHIHVCLQSTGLQVLMSTDPQVHRSSGSQVHRSSGSQVLRSTHSQVHSSSGSQVHKFTGPNFLLYIHVCLQSTDLRSTRPQVLVIPQ